MGSLSDELNEEDAFHVAISIYQDSKCFFTQIAFMYIQGGFCLQVAEASGNEQEACHTGDVLLCLSERINLCLSPLPLRASTVSRVHQSTGSTSSPPQASANLASSSRDVLWVCVTVIITSVINIVD